MKANHIDYKAVLEDLQSKRRAIEDAITAVRQLVESSPRGPTSDTRPLQDKTNKAFAGMTIGDAAVKYLEIAEKPKSLPEITEALEEGGFHHASKNFNNTLRVALVRREGREPGNFKRFGKKWGLAEWTQGRSRKSKYGKDKSQSHEPPLDDTAATRQG